MSCKISKFSSRIYGICTAHFIISRGMYHWHGTAFSDIKGPYGHWNNDIRIGYALLPKCQHIHNLQGNVFGERCYFN